VVITIPIRGNVRTSLIKQNYILLYDLIDTRYYVVTHVSLVTGSAALCYLEYTVGGGFPRTFVLYYRSGLGTLFHI